MSTTSLSTTPLVPESLAVPAILEAAEPEERITIERVGWDEYVQMNDALVERSNPRMIYCEGRLIIMGKSRLHEWLADSLGTFVRYAAAWLGIECEPSGETTFRRQKSDAGLEGDRTFHFGANAIHMRGPKNVDLEVDPPPDLAIEVVVTHSARHAMRAWGHLGVPEVWCFDANAWTCTIWKLDEAGSYLEAEHSQFLPMIERSEICEQMRAAHELGGTPWLLSLERWIESTVRGRVNE